MSAAVWAPGPLGTKGPTHTHTQTHTCSQLQEVACCLLFALRLDLGVHTHTHMHIHTNTLLEERMPLGCSAQITHQYISHVVSASYTNTEVHTRRLFLIELQLPESVQSCFCWVCSLFCFVLLFMTTRERKSEKRNKIKQRKDNGFVQLSLTGFIDSWPVKDNKERAPIQTHTHTHT